MPLRLTGSQAVRLENTNVKDEAAGASRAYRGPGQD